MGRYTTPHLYDVLVDLFGFLVLRCLGKGHRRGEQTESILVMRCILGSRTEGIASHKRRVDLVTHQNVGCINLGALGGLRRSGRGT